MCKDGRPGLDKPRVPLSLSNQQQRRKCRVCGSWTGSRTNQLPFSSPSNTSPMWDSRYAAIEDPAPQVVQLVLVSMTGGPINIARPLGDRLRRPRVVYCTLRPPQLAALSSEISGAPCPAGPR